jgi:hypothetical protein
MIYSQLFKEKSLSLLGMGAMRLPQKGEGWGMPIIHDKAEELIDYVISQGINYFDTAWIYHGGESEVFLGNALKKYPRESFYVADKYSVAAEPNFSYKFEEQLKRLQMDYIDFYLLHAVADQNIDKYLSNGCIEYFMEQKAKGRIKHLGFSFHGSPAALRRMTAHHPFEFTLIQLNYLDWFHGNAKELYEHLREKNIPIMVMEPVHGGLLANLTDEGNAILKEADESRTIASWAIRFVADLPGIAVVLSGMSNLDQAKDNIASISENKPLTENEKEMLKEVSRLKLEKIAATCTRCNYCLKDCPKQLDIPYLLNTFNNYKAGGEWRLLRLGALPEDKKPMACVKCGICTKLCPQNLDIPKFMGEMAEIMGK